MREFGAAAGAVHSVLFKAPRVQFVTLAGSSQANILYEMHFSRLPVGGIKAAAASPVSPSSVSTAPIPADKMSQFKANGAPIKITRASSGETDGAERDPYPEPGPGSGQVGSNSGTRPLCLSYTEPEWPDVEYK